MGTKHNKNQMIKEYENAPEINGYEEKYNDVMLNDITFEELKREEDKNYRKKKRFGFKKRKRKIEDNNSKDKDFHKTHSKNNDDLNNSQKNKKSLQKKLFAKKKTDKYRKNNNLDNEIPIEDVNVEDEALKRSDNINYGLNKNDDTI